MSFMNDAKSWMGKVAVYVEGQNVTVSGLPSDFITRDLYRIWRTERIAANLFHEVGRNKVVFDQFFLPDFYYALKKIMVGKYMRCNRRVVEQLIFEIEDRTWIGNIEKTFPTFLKRERLKNLVWSPEPHQVKYFNFFEQQIQRMNLKGFLLAADPGTGKTYMSMALNEMLDLDCHVYIVPNNSIEEVWDKTHEAIIKDKKATYWTTRSGLPLKPGYKIYIFHYEALEQAVEFFSKHKFGRSSVTVDECHNFNRAISIRTELLQKLCDNLKPVNILWMSGTPIKALGSEVIPLLRSIAPDFTPDVEERFKKIFGQSTTAGLDILAHRLGLISYKIRKDEAVKSKVLNFRVDVRLKNGNEYTLETIRKRMSDYIAERMEYYQKNMSRYLTIYEDGLMQYEKNAGKNIDPEYKRYRNASTDIRENYNPALHKDDVIFCNKFENQVILPTLDASARKPFKNSCSVYKYYHLKVQGEALGRILGRARTMCNADLAVNINNAVMTDLQTQERTITSLEDIINSSIKKTLLYTDYVEVVDKVCDKLETEGYKTLRVYGDTNKDLKSIVKTFETNKKFNPLVATFKSLSTAVPMIMANTIVMLNAPYRDGDFNQTVSRCNRMGQDEDVYVYMIYLDTGTEPNISTRSMDILAWSKEMVNAIMGRDLGDADVAMESYIDDDIDLVQVSRQIINAKPALWASW